MSINEVFELRKNDPKWNTSYPLSPDDWAKYRVHTPLGFEKDKELSFYIHVPFCKQLCSFCEYTRMICPDNELQAHYIHVVDEDITSFKTNHPNIVLRGFDIGGGTPTSLSDENFNLLLDIFDKAKSGVSLSEDFEPSIEGTFSSLSEAKLSRMVQSGIQRLSLGIQTTDTELLCSQHRERIKEEFISKWMDKAHLFGIKKINLDLMYGLKGQTKETVEKDLFTIKRHSPEQVTLYELRTNMIDSKDISSKEKLFSLYKQYYEGLRKLGYYASFGQNTFSLSKDDLGVSSYLRSRMTEGGAYKGFGISAQSMNKKGVSYNCGKNSYDLLNIVKQESYQEEFVYQLLPDEIASKYIAISGYYGSFLLDKVMSDNDIAWNKYIDEVLSFCLEKDLLLLDGKRVSITEVGFLHYGAVLSLFYSPVFKR
ncbi:MAG: radical SAM protein [Bacteroides sp.]|jgi:oxygen-independent coproporphyrinogen-3 oxidase|nr:radical SAM protein [Bacteroides sp.]MBP8687720.1 radical SAM protein [Prevotella sp.]